MAGKVGDARDFYAAHCGLPRPQVAHYVAVIENPAGELAAISTCCDGVDDAGRMLRRALFALTRQAPLDPASDGIIVSREDLMEVLSGTMSDEVRARLRGALGGGHEPPH